MRFPRRIQVPGQGGGVSSERIDKAGPARIARFLGWLAGVMACGVQASPIPEWQMSFGAVGRPPISYNEEPALVRDPVSGAFYLHNFGINGIASMTVRVDASGDVAWANSTARDSSPSTRRVTPLMDGSIVVVTQELQRLGADGSRLWSIPWPSSFDLPIVFEADADTAAHIPEHARRLLSPLDETRARDLRARLIKRINR